MTSLAPTDLSFFEQLPIGVRQDAYAWADALGQITKPIGQSIRQIAARFGVSHQTARRKYDYWRKSGIRGLVNCAKAGITKDAVHGIAGPGGFAPGTKHPDFVAYAKKIAEGNQRKTRPAWRAFIRQWKSGAQIPGLDNNLPRHCRPPGCGYDNFLRVVRDAFAQSATRSGLGAAIAKYGPQIFTTRATLWYGSHYMIDDMWHDDFVVFGKEASTQIVRVLELDCLDVFSGYLPAFGCKPRFRRDDGTMDGLKEKYARLLVANVLFNEGYSPRGTEIIAEHGTAAVSDAVEKILARYAGILPGGKPVISVRRSGITGDEQAVIGWRGQGKGNPRVKAALESIRNLKHNELGSVPGQTGKDRDSRPEYTHGLLVQASEELKAMAAIAQKNPQRAAAMQLRLLNYHSHFLPLLLDVYREINQRDWHDLEGWHAAGNMITEYRTTPTADHWLTNMEFCRLPAVSQQLLLQAAQEDPRYINTRKLSPAEVRRRDGGSLLKLPAFVIAEILGPDFSREGEVKGAYFKMFSDEELSPEPLRYESRIVNPDGREEQLKDGRYLLFVNPFDLQQVFVHDAGNRFLGTAARAARIDMTDVDQVNRAYGRRAHQIAELKKPILKRYADDVRAETKRLEHNAAVMDETRPFTEQEKADADFVRREGSKAAKSILSIADESTTADEMTGSDFLQKLNQ